MTAEVYYRVVNILGKNKKIKKNADNQNLPQIFYKRLYKRKILQCVVKGKAFVSRQIFKLFPI